MSTAKSSLLSTTLDNAAIQAFHHPVIAPPPVGFRGGLVISPELCGGQGDRLRQTRSGKPVDTLDPGAQYTVRLEGDYVYSGLIYHHFGHVMAELVHRILPSRDAMAGGAKLLFVHAAGGYATFAQLPDRIQEIYRFLGVDLDDAIFVNENSIARRLFVSEQGSDLGRGAKPGYLALIEEHSRPRLDAAFGRKQRPARVYVARTSAIGGFLGERYVESVFERAGFFVMRPEQLSFSEQADIYRKAEIVVFPEGSAVHGTELLWEGAIGEAILVNRRENGEIGGLEAVLKQRARQLSTFATNRYVGTLLLDSQNSAELVHGGASYFDLEAMTGFLRERGIRALGAIDRTAYRDAIEKDIPLYIAEIRKAQMVPDERVATFVKKARAIVTAGTGTP